MEKAKRQLFKKGRDLSIRRKKAIVNQREWKRQLKKKRHLEVAETSNKKRFRFVKKKEREYENL